MCNSPYIAKQIKYPTFVDTKNIKYIGDSQFRYSLEIPFRQSPTATKGFVVVIMKNPSSATQAGCDRTISKVCNAAKYNGYDGVIIANLFPYRATNAKQVVNFYAMANYSQIMAKNLQRVLEICANRAVVFAWGRDTIGGHKRYPNNYNDAIINVTSSITSRTFYAVSCSCDGNVCPQKSTIAHQQLRFPLHGLRWSNCSPFINY